MSEALKFESRSGKLTCNSAEVFRFITDLRNFEQFIPRSNIKSWQVSENRCSFAIPLIGSATAEIREKIPDSYVDYSGNVMIDNEFKLAVHISESGNSLATIRLSLTAELNPMLRMMAPKLIEEFLEMLISEMEKFDNWKG